MFTYGSMSQKLAVATAMSWAIAVFTMFPVAVLAQSAAHKTDATSETISMPQLQYQSILGNYQAYTEQDVLPWREANDQVGKIGGWRADAREMSDTPSVPDVSPSPSPSPHNTHQGAGGK